MLRSGAIALPIAISLLSVDASGCLAASVTKQFGKRHMSWPEYHVVNGRLVRPNNDSSYVGWGSSPAEGAYFASTRRLRDLRPYSPPGPVYFGNQYTYAPGRGVIDEACNLPTSSCPNTQRDGQ
jgi:hypothetical protein